MKLGHETISAICERFGWSYCNEYGEPGYGGVNTTYVILGDYWLRGPKDENGKSGLSSVGRKWPRLFQQLADQGVELEWEDEWVDIDCKAYRTQGDSWGWVPSYAISECEFITPESDLDEWIAYGKNNHRVCINDRQVSNMAAKLTAAGWTRQPEDEDFANGWFPGQNDTPETIDAELRRIYGDIDVIFALTENSQFYIKFAAFWKPVDNDTDGE